MRQVQVIADMEHVDAPPVYRLLATAPSVNEARVWSCSFSGKMLELLLVIDGSNTAAREIDEHPSVHAVDMMELGHHTFALLVEMSRKSRLGEYVYQVTREFEGVILPPTLLRDGKMHSRWIGQEETIPEVFTNVPTEIADGVTSISQELGVERSVVESLTARQRQVVQTAVGMGHYSVPREATHADIADELGCSAATITEHLRKAESRIFQQLFPT